MKMFFDSKAKTRNINNFDLMTLFYSKNMANHCPL